MSDVQAIQGAGRLPADAASGSALEPRRPSRLANHEVTPQTQTGTTVTSHATAGLREQLRDELQQRLAGHDVLLSREEETSTWIIQIRDRQSGDVVFQIPPEQMIQLHERLQEVLKDTGLLVDKNT